MARRGTQNKGGPNHASSNWQNTADDDILSTPKRGEEDSENPPSHVQGRSKGSEGSSNKKAKGSKKNSRSSGISSLGKSDDRASFKQQQMDTSFDISSSEENDFPSRTTKNRNGSKKFSRHASGKKVPIEQTSLPGLTENVLEKTKCMACMAVSIFRASMMYVVEETNRYIDTKRPTIDALMAMVKKGHVYAFSKIEFVYPIVRTWMLNAGRLMLLFLAVWLDCNIRGFDSLLRLGTNSLLAVLWCSMLSIFAMIGIKKMLIFMVIAASAVAFIGLGFAILLIAVLAVVILWIYGSFWTTSSVIVLGEQSSGRSGNIFEEFQQSSADSTSQSGYAQASDRSPGDPSTSGAEKELTSEDEVARLLSCTDHYSALGFRRYENIDASSLKREYKKKAMLVHPDKNMGNDKAADAFKKLQNAYEVLLDSLKRKTYDDELRREELLNYFRRFQSVSQKDCNEFHQAKDGDGWVEQSFQPILFGILHKPDSPHAYVCAESYIFDVTEWFSCQGMRCPANTHKPSFHVNASMAKQSGKGKSGSGVPSGTNMDGEMNEEEFFEWLQNAVQSGMFETTFRGQSEPPSPGSGSNGKGGSNSNKKKKKGKKQW
ncbi:hypothetical protein PR202_gb10378 [Eleusine coracana subsp. coracana]|uniref:J domain-containing protein n=1 Tax=Eleusine coracana subsp. coracana TaxID=191504 RepID=A0AAV5EJK2_ELECO|nr:hypothetical protein PR202_gb10378 [Eleusine coracana subsp. coracana]